MKKNLFSVLWILLSVCSAFSSDTLRTYQPKSRLVYYNNEALAAQAARFELFSPAYIKSVTLYLEGDSAGTARVRLCGHEGGREVPFFRDDLTEARTVSKKKDGMERIEILLSHPVFLANNQFFVVVDNASPGVRLLSESMAKAPVCSAAKGGDFYSQLLMDKDGQWYSGVFGYAVDVVLDYQRNLTPALKDAGSRLGFSDSLRSVSSIAAYDIDADSYLDILINGKLYKNDKGHFQDITSSAGLTGIPKASVFIDVNNDGRIDILFIGSGEADSVPGRSRLFVNAGANKFTEYTLPVPPVHNPVSINIADINGDGYADMFIGQASAEDGEGSGAGMQRDIILINDHKLGFLDRSEIISSEAGNTRASQWIDFDNDRDLDLFIAKYSAGGSELWLNNGNLRFTNVAADKGLGADAANFGTGCHWSDYDNDGDMDLVLSRSDETGQSAHPGTAIYNNSGHPLYKFTRMQDAQKLEYEEKHSGATWSDINNDGLSDIILSTSCGCRYSDVYIQNPQHGFELQTANYGLQRHAGGSDCLTLDINNDGKLDLATCEQDRFTIYVNEGEFATNYIAFDLVPLPGNGAAPGAKVSVHTGEGSFTQELASGRGLLRQDPLRLHFGLGKTAQPDSVIVHWADGRIEKFTDLKENSTARLEEGHGIEVHAHQKGLAGIHTVIAKPNPFTDEIIFSYTIDSAQPVQLDIYSLDGKKVKSLVNQENPPGQYTVKWNASDESGARLSQGTYIYRFNAGETEVSEKIILAE